MAKERNTRGRFAGIPRKVTDHPDYIALSGNAVKLLVEAARQYNGHNNGKLCFVWSQMILRGWKSKGTLNRAKIELVTRTLIQVSKQGGLVNGKGTPTFYALTWEPVDEINGFITEIKPSRLPSRSFREAA